MGIRTYGLSGSGMDVDQMVKDLMKAQRARYDTLGQKKTQMEWKKADFNTMYTTINDFRNTVFSYKLSNTVSPKVVSSQDEKVVKVTANAEASNVNHKIEVYKLAEGVTLASSQELSAYKGTLTEQFGADLPSGDIVLNISDGKVGKEIKVNKDGSLNDLVSQINNSGVGIQANYDATLGRFFLYSKNTGSNVKIDISGSNAVDFMSNVLKIPASSPGTISYAGTDAEFSLDGIGNEVDAGGNHINPLKQANNTFTVSGVTYDLKGTGNATVSVKPDNDKTIANVKAFVEAYNTLLSKLNGEVAEARYKNFLPLTSDQKSAMSESDIKAWEEKAKSGLLHNDPILRDLVSKMRSDIASPIAGLSGKYTSLASIGITTSMNYLENGKLVFDEAAETKLKKALEQDPDIVNKLFATKVDKASSSKQGIAVRMYDTLKGAMDKITDEAGFNASTTDDTKSTLAKLIRDYGKQMDVLNTRLADMEDRYYKQFDAMEAALSKLGQQSSWLIKQFGS
ncbi:Flagellar hook-associated protein 2 [Sporomusa ovata DSM 2662]|uniref:Flagellar hook-associated protein 2 n=1 Tax=Sporomusa ovata TaxID=2378 RepID=A0A0U1KSQ9_9FIRM|nr:flagellar filament capping protein FliD [Sporomusa ovata]EQB26372.1 flagellar hook-associated protein 2 [Sporomusa ovata DSM 2662]CQR70452.1 Flagellar hook-associated protein FliD [Sporomusa ovata]